MIIQEWFIIIPVTEQYEGSVDLDSKTIVVMSDGLLYGDVIFFSMKKYAY